MNYYRYICVLLYLLILFTDDATAQDSAVSRIAFIPHKLFTAIDKKTALANDKLNHQTQKYLTKLQKQEAKLKKQLLKRDSLLATQLFSDLDHQYTSLSSVAQNFSRQSSVYSPHLDSLCSALGFLKARNVAPVAVNPEVEKTLQHLQRLQERLNQTDQIQKSLKQRQLLYQEQLQKLGMVKALRRFHKQVYYYRAQVREYKQAFEDPNKWEAKLMDVVMKFPQFKDFFARNSQLGSLFALPASDGSFTTPLQGLQTRTILQEQLAQRFGSGTEVTKMLQQNVQQAQNSLSALKNKVSTYTNGTYGNTSTDIEQPHFTPNHQKTKSFLKRLEYGGNLQTQKAKSYFPVTSDIAATLGYRLRDKSAIGVGASYKIGWGSGIQNIKVTHQGIGLRSYVDLKFKGSLFISGGYELNYRTLFHTIDQLKDYAAWQKSGLVGLTKKYTVSKKINGNMQLLWDFLSYQQVPRTQAIQFRVGYGLR